MENVASVVAAEQHRNITNASKAKNPFESLPKYLEYSTADTEFTLYSKHKNDMNSQTLKWAFKLAEKNVSGYYKICSLGWQPKVKQSDMNKSWARYLVALDNKKNPIAFAMFRFDLDYQYAVLYCYEIHIEEEHRRKGLGKFIMTALEKCANVWKMDKIVLTVLKNNPNAMDFFTKLGYKIDESSPDKSEKADYEILSKSLD